MELIQFDGRTCAVMAPEDVEELESRIATLEAELKKAKHLAVKFSDLSEELEAKVSTLESQLAEATRGADELLLAVSALMKAFDDGIFVRDTSNDHRPDWAIRLLNPLRALAVLREASDAALRDAMGG